MLNKRTAITDRPQFRQFARLIRDIESGGPWTLAQASRAKRLGDSLNRQGFTDRQIRKAMKTL